PLPHCHPPWLPWGPGRYHAGEAGITAACSGDLSMSHGTWACRVLARIPTELSFGFQTDCPRTVFPVRIPRESVPTDVMQVERRGPSQGTQFPISWAGGFASLSRMETLRIGYLLGLAGLLAACPSPSEDDFRCNDPK